METWIDVALVATGLGTAFCAGYWVSEFWAAQRSRRNPRRLEVTWDVDRYQYDVQHKVHPRDRHLVTCLFHYGVGKPTTTVRREKLLSTHGERAAVEDIREQLKDRGYNPDTLRLTVEAR